MVSVIFFFFLFISSWCVICEDWLGNCWISVNESLSGMAPPSNSNLDCAGGSFSLSDLTIFLRLCFSIKSTIASVFESEVMLSLFNIFWISIFKLKSSLVSNLCSLAIWLLVPPSKFFSDELGLGWISKSCLLLLFIVSLWFKLILAALIASEKREMASSSWIRKCLSE